MSVPDHCELALGDDGRVYVVLFKASQMFDITDQALRAAPDLSLLAMRGRLNEVAGGTAAGDGTAAAAGDGGGRAAAAAELDVPREGEAVAASGDADTGAVTKRKTCLKCGAEVTGMLSICRECLKELRR